MIYGFIDIEGFGATLCEIALIVMNASSLKVLKSYHRVIKVDKSHDVQFYNESIFCHGMCLRNVNKCGVEIWQVVGELSSIIQQYKPMKLIANGSLDVKMFLKEHHLAEDVCVCDFRLQPWIHRIRNTSHKLSLSLKESAIEGALQSHTLYTFTQNQNVFSMSKQAKHSSGAHCAMIDVIELVIEYFKERNDFEASEFVSCVE